MCPRNLVGGLLHKKGKTIEKKTIRQRPEAIAPRRERVPYSLSIKQRHEVKISHLTQAVVFHLVPRNHIQKARGVRGGRWSQRISTPLSHQGIDPADLVLHMNVLDTFGLFSALAEAVHTAVQGGRSGIDRWRC